MSTDNQENTDFDQETKDNQQLTKFIRQISEAYNDGEDQRRAANEDIRFCNVDGGMWEQWLADTHSDRHKRAKLEFDITSNFVNRFRGEMNLNRVNVQYTPNDDVTSDDQAELLTGIYRADFKDNDGQIAQDNAVGEQAQCGVGHFKMLAKFSDEEDPENESQDIHFEPIYNSYSTVIWDPQAKRIDKKDAGWCTVLTTYTRDSFKHEFPDTQPVSAYTPMTRRFLDWIKGDLIYIAEMYRAKIKHETVAVYQNVELGEIASYPLDEAKKIRDELAEEGWTFVRNREIKRRTIEKSIFSGLEFIEKDVRIAGKFIPVIPMYGYRAYIDGLERYYGLVRKLKDANRILNTSMSRMAETSASSPDEVPILTTAQVEGREEDWSSADRHAYELINGGVDENGNPIAPGPISYTRPPAIDPNTLQMAEFASTFAQQLTGAPQDTIDPQASGKAINAMIGVLNLNTQILADNRATAVKHSGTVYLSIANEVYANLRTKRVAKQDGTVDLVQINTTIMDDDSGREVVAATIVDGDYAVDVDVGPQYESQRDATADKMLELIQIASTIDVDIRPMVHGYIENIKGTGLDGVKEFGQIEKRKYRLELMMQGWVQPENEEEEADLERFQQQQAESQEAEAQTLEASLAKQADADAVKSEAEAGKTRADTGKSLAETKKTEAETVRTKAQTVEILEGSGIR